MNCFPTPEKEMMSRGPDGPLMASVYDHSLRTGHKVLVSDVRGGPWVQIQHWTAMAAKILAPNVSRKFAPQGQNLRSRDQRIRRGNALLNKIKEGEKCPA